MLAIIALAIVLGSLGVSLTVTRLYMRTQAKQRLESIARTYALCDDEVCS